MEFFLRLDLFRTFLISRTSTSKSELQYFI